ncbi:helix-turn-helix domain-containing protein [Candidatus Woesearchaeota archaeon]|nr:helix-turn-helix domain-containing protein [Candidatus Woesearchaeota archaeon]
MPNDETFLLLSLEEQQSKELAQVISNETARKILDYLGKKNEASESQIAEALDTPISTVHYNVQQLLKSKLIETKEFEWSEKGKKILYYKLAKKLIVIAPKTSDSLYNQLKNLIPVSLFTLVTGGIIYYLTRASDKINFSKQIFSELIPAAADNAADSGAFTESAMKISENLEAGQTLQVVNKTTEIITQTQNITNEPLWFFIGAGFVIILMLFVILIKRKKLR